MKIFNKIRALIQSFQAEKALPLPIDGRSSNETVGGAIGTALQTYSTVSPIVNFDALKLLKNFAIFNPDVSQFCDNIINLSNTGHNIQIDASSSSIAEQALNRLNETATRLYKNGAGVDGLMNAYAFQVSWSGALSSEDVVNIPGKRVEQTVLVPVEQIRFKYNAALGFYEPYQKPINALQNANRTPFGLIPLHPTTYRYYALQTIENSPYGKPPASAAIETICESQKPILENIRYIAQKFGLLGLFTAAVTPPSKNAGETITEHQARSEKYLSEVTKALLSYIREGLVVSYRDQKIEHTNIADGARGVYDLNRISEEQVMSGLGMQPAFFGRTDSTTETYADVVYSLLLAKVHNIQRLIKRRQEQTYRLDLRLGGLEVDGVSIKFNKTFSRNTLEETQADQTKWEVVLAKVTHGVISPDQGAQELGYESWYDEDLIADAPPSVAALMRSQQKLIKKFSFNFNQGSQRYEFVRPQIVLSGDAFGNEEASVGNVIPIKKKAQQA
ncbi:hypothetical protein Bpfe_031026 [Biomphalaria pfeifferi]|uniref:Uncharacterized protein n=1 Tax=Biomphalaria pfeifferi TaxID=112525 RepID=A0AAD8ANJ6_BIOPF|nr:hypothetical protein Bpfe_031026 [Biomphalaria pfeifferi]